MSSFWGVFWADVGSQSTAENGFLAIAKAIGSPAESIEESLQVLANTKERWLLILDNADDTNFDYTRYIPSGVEGVVIMTSRIPQCSQYSTLPAEALEGLDVEHCTQLLLKAARVPEESWQSKKARAQDIVQLLGSHTLALIQAGAYIAEGHCQLSQYPDRYQRQRKRLLQHHPDQQQSRYRNVYATFEASADVLRSSDNEAGQDALDILATLSMLQSSEFPLKVYLGAWRGAREVLQASHADLVDVDALSRWHVDQLPQLINAQADEWDDHRLIKASAQLISLSLVTSHGSENLDGLSMHPLAHAWAKDRLTQELQQAAWVRVGCLLALSRSKLKTWHEYERRLRPHLQSFLSLDVEAMFLSSPQGKMLPILLKCGWALNVMREDSRLEALLAGIYRQLQITPTDPSQEHIGLWDLAARNLVYMGHARQAVKLLEHVVKVQKTTLKATHSDQRASQHDLAVAYIAAACPGPAIALLEDMVKEKESMPKDSTPNKNYHELLASQYSLANAYIRSKRFKEAIALLERVIEAWNTTLKETHPFLLASQHALANAYLGNKQEKEAVALLEPVVEIRKTTLMETHPSRLASEHVLARAYKANGQTQKAVALLKHVVKVHKTTLKETPPGCLASHCELARTYKADGQVKKAVTLLQHVVAVKTQTKQTDDDLQLLSEQELANQYHHLLWKLEQM